MSIQVTCPGCLKRFNVSDKFAGKTGPCPSCGKQIKIPDKSEEVVIHAPEDAGPKDSKGKSILKPIRRKDVKLGVPTILVASIGTLVVFGLAFGIRFSGGPATAVLVAGSLLLAPPLAFVGYWFMQDDELEGYTGRALWMRLAICSLAFAGTWALYGFVPAYVSGYKSLADITSLDMVIMIPIMIGLGTVIAVAVFELEALQGALLYAFYLIVTLALALIMGTPLAGPFKGGGQQPTIRPSQAAPANPPQTSTQTKPAVPQTTPAPATPAPTTPTPQQTNEPERPRVNVLQ